MSNSTLRDSEWYDRLKAVCWGVGGVMVLVGI